MIYIISKFQCRLINTTEHLKFLEKEIELGLKFEVNSTDLISSGFQKVFEKFGIS